MVKKKSLHDKKVRTTASRYKRNGWSVRADISGYKRPNSIGKYNRIPDVVAKKGKKIRVFEVETPKSMKTDLAQISTFRKHAANKKNTTFKVLVAKNLEKRRDELIAIHNKLTVILCNNSSIKGEKIENQNEKILY